MPLTARWIPYGDAAAALAAEVRRAKAGEPLAPVTVVVPTNPLGVSARRQLARGSHGAVVEGAAGLVAVDFLTVHRLAELLGASVLAAAGRRPVSTPVLAAAVRAELARQPGSFGPVADHEATEAALVASVRELRDLDDGRLAAVAGHDRRTAEVVRLHRATRARLVEHWYDEHDLLAAATAAVPTADLSALGSLVVHLPQRLGEHEAALLRAIAERVPVSVLAGWTGAADADDEVRAALARLRLDPDTDLEPPLERPSLPTSVTTGTTRIVTCSDADDEVRAAVRAVAAAADAGTPLDRLAILHASPEPYGRLVHEHLALAGIPCNGTAAVAVGSRLAGRTLLRLLELPALGFRRDDVFAWLSSAPLLHRGRWAPVSAWERLSRDAAVVGGRRDWDQRLAALAETRTADAERWRLDPDVPDWRADRAEADAAMAFALRAFVLGLVDRLADAAAAPASWSERSRWARRLLDDLLGGPTRRSRWPVAEQRAAERVELALDRLAALDAVEGSVELDVFARTLQVELDADLGRTGRFGDGVLVGSVAMGVGLDLDLVVVLGLAEGSFPTVVRDDSLLPDDARARTGGALALRAGGVGRQHRQLLATLAAARRQVLGVPRGDLRRSAERTPSRWVLDVAGALAGERWWPDDLLHADVPWVEHVASFTDGLRRLDVPATGQEHRLRTLLALDARPAQLAEVAPSLDARLAVGVEVVDARRSPRLTRFDGLVTGVAVPSPVQVGASATALERWAGCPHAYLLADVLGVRPVEDPEDGLQMAAVDRGSLVHQVLELFLTEVLDGPPEPGEAWTPEQRARLRTVAAEVLDAYERDGRTGRPVFWRRDRERLLHELDRFLAADDDHRRGAGARPHAAELAFGIGGQPPVALALPDGRTVPLRGKADRVDVCDDGTLVVLDYKTGSPRRYRGLDAADPHQGGRHLQLGVYAAAARQHVGRPEAPVDAAYWFVSTRGGFDKLGYRVTDDVLAEVAAAVGRIVAGIEGGLFAAHPPEPSTSPFVECPYCDPDGLGTADARRRFLTKLADPALAPYLALVGAADDEGDVTTSEGGDR